MESHCSHYFYFGGEDGCTCWVGDWVGFLPVLKETTNYCCYEASYFTDGTIMGLLPVNQLHGAVLGKLLALINK
jgi:hypothetical protein